MKLFLKGARVIDPTSGRDETLNLFIREGTVEKIGPSVSVPSSAQVVDLKGKIIAPGFIDMHVHLREPGYEHKETILTGCTAAAEGGFTAVCCMPNTTPPIDDESVIKFIQNKARVALDGLVDVYPIAAVTVGRKGEHLSPMAELATAGAVAFSDDGDPVYDAEMMRRALEYAAMYNRPIIQHAQDTSLTKGGAMNEGFVATELGLGGIPGIAEEVVVSRDISITRFTNGQYHVAHVSTAGTVALVREAKNMGLKVTCEATPHHFTLTEDAVRSYDTNTKMNPPLRTREDVEAIRAGLRDGTIEVIASDHAPHTFDEKQVEFQIAPFGIIGLETTVGLCVTHLVRAGVLTMYQLVEKLSVNPRKILHLPEVRCAEGEPANLTILDPEFQWIVDPAAFKSKSKNTPFGGVALHGRAVGVINNRLVYWA